MPQTAPKITGKVHINGVPIAHNPNKKSINTNDNINNNNPEKHIMKLLSLLVVI